MPLHPARRYRYVMLVIWLAILAGLGPVSIARGETDDEFRRRSERARKITRAIERVEAAYRELSEAQAEFPELAEAMRRERQSVRDLNDDAVEIERKQATFTDLISTAFPWAASLLALGGGYAGGRKHEQRIVRKRGSGAGGGGADRDRFRESGRDSSGRDSSETPNAGRASDQG